MAKRDFLVSIDLNKNELLNARLQNIGILPALTTGDTGYFVWNDGTAKFWTGTSWKSLEETVATSLNISSDIVTISLTPITGALTTGALTGQTTTLSGATSSKAGLLTGSMYDKLMGTVAKTDFDAYSILAANLDNQPFALTANTYTVFGRTDDGIQAIPIDLSVTGVTTNSSIPSSYAIKNYVDNLLLPTGHYHYQLYQPNGSNPFVYTDNSGTLHIDGNIVQNGSGYTVHAQDVYTTGNTITLRDGAVAGLGVSEYVGFVAKLYDGVNDGQLVFDKNGVARVGDTGNLQPLATRTETPTDGYIAYWENANTRLNFKQLTISDITNLNTWTGSTSIKTLGTITGGTWNATIIASQYGGTGVNNGGRTLTINTNSGTLSFTNPTTTLTIANTASVSGTNTGDVTLAANNGLSLTGQQLALGTPSYITATSTNSVTNGSHTHAVSGLTTSNLASNAGILNGQLANSSITLGTTAISLGSSSLTLGGLTSVSATTFTGSLSGNASTATKLQTPRTIALSGDTVGTATSFDGSGNITIPVTLPNITTGGVYNNVVVNAKGQVTSGTTIDYLTANDTITISGEATGTGTTGITLTLSTAAVIGKLLTGYTATSGSISAADSILTAIQKLGYDKHVAVTLATNNGLSLTGQQLALGTPSHVTASSTNSVTNGSHTHAVSGLTTSNLASNAGILNGQLANSSITLGTTAISLGSSSLTLGGLTSVSATTFTGALSGNASTATKLQTPRTIALSGDTIGTATSFDGSANISIPVILPNITTAGTFTQVVVNAKGQVISGNTPTTLSGYSITDAYHKFTTTITGNGVGSSFIITHNLNTEDILTSVRDLTTKAKVEVEEIIQDANNLILNFNVAPINGKQYRVIIGG